MENMDLAIAVFVTNIVIAIGVVAWCNKKIKDLTDKDNWK
jgi:hypothetical protein